jgi:hypothetical protein
LLILNTIGIIETVSSELVKVMVSRRKEGGRAILVFGGIVLERLSFIHIL